MVDEDSGKAAACAEGSYGNASGLVSQANCSYCPAGHACPEAATAPREEERGGQAAPSVLYLGTATYDEPGAMAAQTRLVAGSGALVL